MPSGKRNATAYPYQIHEIDRHRYGPRSSPKELSPKEQFAVDLFEVSQLEGEPFFQFYEIMQSAIRSFNEGRFRTCLISTATAFEVLIQIVIRQTSPLHGYSQSRIDETLNCGLTDQLKVHIPLLTGCVVDLDDRENKFGSWWQEGYKIRNLVIHQAMTPTRDQANTALRQANDVTAALRGGLLNRPKASAVGRALLWGMGSA